MSNELIAVYLTAFYIVFSRKADLCAAIILYYCAVILTNAYTVGFRFDYSPEFFYIQQSIIDLAAIVFICYLSRFHQNAVMVYSLYAAIITLSMALNGLMLLDQYAGAYFIVGAHLTYQEYAHWIDVFFAIVGSANVNKFIARFLPFGGR